MVLGMFRPKAGGRRPQRHLRHLQLLLPAAASVAGPGADQLCRTLARQARPLGHPYGSPKSHAKACPFLRACHACVWQVTSLMHVSHVSTVNWSTTLLERGVMGTNLVSYAQHTAQAQHEIEEA